MQNLHLSTVSGKLFWASLLIYCSAFAGLYFLTQHSHQALAQIEKTGVYANFVNQICMIKSGCDTWKFQHKFSRESKKLDAVLEVPYQNFKKLDPKKFQKEYTNHYEQLPWNVKRQLSGKLNVIAVNFDVGNQK